MFQRKSEKKNIAKKGCATLRWKSSRLSTMAMNDRKCVISNETESPQGCSGISSLSFFNLFSVQREAKIFSTSLSTRQKFLLQFERFMKTFRSEGLTEGEGSRNSQLLRNFFCSANSPSRTLVKAGRPGFGRTGLIYE